MKKIISLFKRNYDGDHLVRSEVVEGAEWVLNGEGVPTKKIDGTCCLVRENRLYKRFEVKPGKTPPPDFEPANEVDLTTGKQQGWVPVGEGPEDRFHREAMYNACYPPDGTYELVGPKIQGNPEGFTSYELIPHSAYSALLRLSDDVPRDFEGIKRFLSTHDIEGIVWHHPDGRMVKIKTKDFGLKRSKGNE